MYRPGSQLPAALPALQSERHNVRIALGSTGTADPVLEAHTVAHDLTGGKFENLNRVLAAATPGPAPATTAAAATTATDRRRRAPTG